MKKQSGVRFDFMALLSALMLGGCSDFDRERQIISEIEESIKLPKGAGPMSSYSRYYAQQSDGAIIAAYVIHGEGFKDDVLRACREVKGTPFPCPTRGGQVRLAEAGKSLWIGDPHDLPFILDGGCTDISVEYHPRTKRFAHVECAGRL